MGEASILKEQLLVSDVSTTWAWNLLEPTNACQHTLHKLSANTTKAKLTNHFQRTKLMTTSSDKHYSLAS